MHLMGLKTSVHLLKLWSVKIRGNSVLNHFCLRKGNSTFYMMCYLCFHILITGSFPKQILGTDCNILINRILAVF